MGVAGGNLFVPERGLKPYRGGSLTRPNNLKDYGPSEQSPTKRDREYSLRNRLMRKREGWTSEGDLLLAEKKVQIR